MQSPINEIDAIAAAGIEAALESPTVFQVAVQFPIGDHNEYFCGAIYQNNKINERLFSSRHRLHYRGMGAPVP